MSGLERRLTAVFAAAGAAAGVWLSAPSALTTTTLWAASGALAGYLAGHVVFRVLRRIS